MRTLLDVEEPAPDRWRVEDDAEPPAVRISFTDEEIVFEGDAGSGAAPASLHVDLGPTDLAAFDGVAFRGEGQGHRFRLRLITGDDADGPSYVSTFEAPDGESRQVRLPFAEFRIVGALDEAPPLDPARIRALSFLVADGHTGPFRLRVEWVRAYRGPATR